MDLNSFRRGGIISESLFALLSEHAQVEFNDLLDYSWKTPRLIETLEAHEIAQLALEPTEQHRSARWAWESRSLHRIFPRLIASSNLFLATSLLEFQVLRLARLAMRYAESDSRVSGISSVFAALRNLGIRPELVDLWPQVHAGILFRNALAHAHGVLDYSRDSTEIQRVVGAQTYLLQNHRRGEADARPPLVTIENSRAGSVLAIDNTYSWLFAGYARDFFIGLCMAAFDRFPRGDEFAEQIRITLENHRGPRSRQARST